MSRCYDMTVLLTSKIVKFFTKISDQRERGIPVRAVARIGWRPCRLVFRRNDIDIVCLPEPDKRSLVIWMRVLLS